jgi:hypothetical protein
MKWAGDVTPTVDRRDAYRILMRKPEGKRPPRRSRHKWEDNIKMDPQDVRWGND